MTRHFRWSLTLTLGTLTAGVSWMGVQVHQSVSRLIGISKEVEHSRDRLDRLQEAMVLLNDAETSQRGMLLTGNSAYLVTYASSRARVARLVDALAAEVPGRNLLRLAAAIDQKFAEMSRTLELNTAGDHAGAIELVRTDRGELLKREISARIERIGTIERQRLDTLKREAASSATGSLSWLLARLGMTVFMALGLYVMIAVEIRRRRRAEVVLRESEERFRGGFEAAAIGMALVAPDGRFIKVNRALCESVGYSEEELLARDFRSITHPDDLDVGVAQVAKLLTASARSFEWEKRYVHKSGRVVHVMIGVSLVPDEAGRPRYFVAQIQDVTARVLAEKRADERRFIESVADALPLALYLFDLVEQRTIWANARDAELFGLKPDEMTSMEGLAVERMAHPEDRPEIAKHQAEQLATALDGEICEVEYRVYHADGQWHWIRRRDVVFDRDADGRARQVLGMGEDVTERRRAAVELARARAQLADAIESLDSGLVIYDADERLVVCNRRYREIYAAAADLMTPGVSYEAIFRAFYERSTWPEGSPTLEEFVAHRLVSHRTRRGVREQQHGDRWLRVDDFSTAEGGVVSLRTDITEMKRTEEDLRRARDAARAAERAKAEFLANMSHEIRTPMNGVLGMAELALGTTLTPCQREYVATIKSSAESLLTVINDILDFSKVEAGKLSLDQAPFSLRTCLDDTLRTFAHRSLKKGLELRVDVNSATPDLLLGDPHRLRQVLMNLVSNAIKFTGLGEVVVSVERVGGDESGDVLAFSIIDTGIGVPEDRRQAIFEPFEQADSSTTRKFGGTGLGLAISAKLVALMGGSIRVDGRPEGGSIFRFTAKFGRPAADAIVPLSSDQPLGVSAHSVGPLRILLVEDNLVNQIVALHMLERLGHQATVVGDGRAALDAMDSGQFDLVLMDVQMPGMDGFETVAEVRRIEADLPGKRTPVVALTAHAMAGDRERCLDVGFDAYVSKPIRIDELSETLAKIADDLPARGPAVFRPETLAELCDSDPEIITDVLETFLGETPAALDSIAKALDSGDLVALSRAAHGLKGACQTVGADALAATSRLLEKLSDLASSAPSFRHRLDREWTELVKAIETHLRKLNAVEPAIQNS